MRGVNLLGSGERGSADAAKCTAPAVVDNRVQAGVQRWCYQACESRLPGGNVGRRVLAVFEDV